MEEPTAASAAAPAASAAAAPASTAATDAAAGVTSAVPPAAVAAGVTSAAPPAAAGAAPFAATEAHKRKYAELAFRSSKYYTMRAIAKDLRPFVVEVLRVPDLRSNKAAQEILTKMKFMIELLKEMRVESAFSRELKKFKEEPGLTGASKDVPMAKLKKFKEEPGLTGASKDVPMAKPQGGETHAPAQAQPGVPPPNPAVPEKQHSRRMKQARNPGSGRTAEEMKESGKQGDGEIPLSYVVGGSPIGWNFLLFPGGRAVYYGVTKATARLRRAAK